MFDRARNWLEDFLPFLQAAQNRKAFFNRIVSIFPASSSEYKDIERAYNVAKDAFRGDEREDGDRYFEHLRAVALILIEELRIADRDLIIAALLHDIVEDKDSWTIERVRDEFGVHVAEIVDWVTKPPVSPQFLSREERDEAYNRRMASAPREPIIVKLADRLHNTVTLLSCSLEKRLRKIEETRRWYLPLAIQEIILVDKLEWAIERIEKSLEEETPST